MKIETAKPVPGLSSGYGENIIYADYTHSLLGALALSAVFALIFGPLWGKRCAIVLGLVSFSHWMLDLIVHRHDMPLLPGNLGHLPRLGFGLWQFKTVSALMELLLVILGAWCYCGRERLTADTQAMGYQFSLHTYWRHQRRLSATATTR